MRKLLLAATAIAASGGIAVEAAAQTSPAVRIAGYMRFHYGYVEQDKRSNAETATGTNDFHQEAEIHARVEGRAANGMNYGAVIEVQFDGTRPDGDEVGDNTQGSLDEAYVFLASERWGRVELGNQDGMGNQMLVGNMILFGAGAFDGDYADFIIGDRPFLSQMDESGDATKINYRSPRFFGFDIGASFAFNASEGSLECSSLGDSCQQLEESAEGVADARNTYELMLRYARSVGDFGFELGGGVIGSDAVDGRGAALARDGNLYYLLGAEIEAYGLTLGANYQWGKVNVGGGTLTSDGNNDEFSQITAGAIYGRGPWKIGVQWFEAEGEGSATAPADRKDKGIAIGGNYVLAPGLELIVEWNSSETEEAGTDRDQSQDIVIVGARLSF